MYQIVRDPASGFYHFQTAKGLTYICRFQGCTNQLSPVLGVYDIEIYEFDFTCYSPQPFNRELPSKDDRVSATIVHLLSQFFSHELRVIVYLCDSIDGRHKVRHRLFEHWHRLYAQHYLMRLPVDIEWEDENVTAAAHGCVIIRNDFPHLDVLKHELINNAFEIITEKYGY